MGERMFVMSTCEGPKEDEISSQVRGKLRIQRGRADRPPKDLHDRIGIQPDTNDHISFH